MAKKRAKKNSKAMKRRQMKKTAGGFGGDTGDVNGTPVNGGTLINGGILTGLRSFTGGV